MEGLFVLVLLVLSPLSDSGPSRVSGPSRICELRDPVGALPSASLTVLSLAAGRIQGPVRPL